MEQAKKVKIMSSSAQEKKILFVSGIDFKEKSIQVIRKTPEAYASHHWTVHYLVGRDTSRYGDYFYEPVINPPGVIVHRFRTPLAFLDSMWNNRIWKALAFRIRNFFLWAQLVIRTIRLLRKQKFHIVYGYEMFGVLALRFVRSIGFARTAKFVIRFQGVYAGEWERKGQWYRKLANYDYFLALKTKGDLCIMTNDGTKGVDLLKALNNRTPEILFYVNGVDEVIPDQALVQGVRAKYFPKNIIHFISVSRLVPQKRVDRSIRIIHSVVNYTNLKNIRYTIIGSGAEHDNLTGLIKELGLEQHVFLIGSIKNTDVKNYLACADFFLSMDTISNVGNPLLEAIRNNKLIVTLNNGDTGRWIEHRKNGLIYDVTCIDLTEADYLKIASDIASVASSSEDFENMKRNLAITEKNKLWTWEQRMMAEVENVGKLLIK